MKFSISFCLALLSLQLSAQTATYQLDQGHTYIGFDVERFLVGEVSGRFNDFSATINMTPENVSTLELDVIIEVAGLDSNNDIRDGHLKGAMWLDEPTHPQIRFTATDIKHQAGDTYQVTGEFTIKGTTRTVSFPAEILGPFKDPTQKVAIGFKADFSVNRFDYGLQFNQRLDNGDFFIGEEVKIKIRALAYQQI